MALMQSWQLDLQASTPHLELPLSRIRCSELFQRWVADAQYSSTLTMHHRSGSPHDEEH
jgi:hypothetical protein